MDTLLADVRHGLRLLRKSPGFSVVVIATLALGIGANTAIVSTVDAVLLRALPYAEPDRVVMVSGRRDDDRLSRTTPAPGNYADWARLSRSFSGLAATRGATASLTGDGVRRAGARPRRFGRFLSVLGVRPLLGRTFTDEEDRAHKQVVIISHGLWRRRYGGDASMVGRAILMNGTRYDVVGVMPREFVFRNRDVAYWVPIGLSPAIAADRTSHFLNVVGRAGAGRSRSMRRATTCGAIDAQLRQQYPGDNNRNLGSVVVPIREELVGDTRGRAAGADGRRGRASC